MKYPCDMVKDLLPLYHDNVCSDSSRKIIEEHLLECDSCKGIMEKIDNETYDIHLQEERENVVEHHTKNVKRKSLLAGLCISGILAVPILVCLIVNLATGHALDWFFIVLTSLMVLASITVVPLITEERKGLLTLGSFTGSLMLLFLACCLYYGGNWFFITSVSTLFGLSVVFLPYVLKRIPLNGFAMRHKGLIAMAVDTVLLYAIVIISGLSSIGAYHWQAALLNTTVCTIFPWSLFAVIRYLRFNRLEKAGICVIIGGIFSSLIHDIIYWIQEGIWHISLVDANLRVWNSDAMINANMYLLILLSGCTVGAILLAAGILRNRLRKVKPETKVL